MAAFTNGSELGSTTLEAAFVEVALLALEADRSLETPTGNVSDDIAANGASMTLTINLPITQSLVSGKIQLEATNYLATATTNPTYAFTGSELVATHLPAALLEMASKIQTKEAAQNLNVLSLTLDTDARQATIAATLNLTRTLEVDGSQKLAVVPYLA